MITLCRIASFDGEGADYYVVSTEAEVVLSYVRLNHLHQRLLLKSFGLFVVEPAYNHCFHEYRIE